jgi:hypothetical protein
MMNRNQFRKVTRTSILLGIALVGATASAAVRSFPGATCFRTSGGTFSAIGGGVQNTSTTSELNVKCPVDRDRAGNPIVTFFYQAFDRNSTRNINCTLCNDVILQGSVITSNCSSASTTGSSANVQAIGFGVPSSVAINFEHTYMTCSIPRVETAGQNSRLLVYRLEE